GLLGLGPVVEWRAVRQLGCAPYPLDLSHTLRIRTRRILSWITGCPPASQPVCRLYGRAQLFSPEFGRPSIAEVSCVGLGWPRRYGLHSCGLFEAGQLFVRKNDKEGFEDHDRFSQAGVQIIEIGRASCRERV